MNDERRQAAHTSLCIWLLLIIALALFMMFGAACPVYGQMPLTDPPVWQMGWGVRVASADPIDVTIATAKNLYYQPGTKRTPEVPCQWNVKGWPIHATAASQFTVYLVRARVTQTAPACDPTLTISDVFLLINHVFAAGPRPTEFAADANGDGAVNGADVFRVLACVWGGADAVLRTEAAVTSRQRIAAVAVPFGPCDKPATTSVTVRDAAHGFATGDWLYVEYNPAVDVLRCGGTDQYPLWCGPAFVVRGAGSTPALEWMR